MTFSEITIIFNPNSTGDSEKLAKGLRRQLQKQLPNTPLSLVATRYPGHARSIAEDAAKRSKQPLIVSSSGDGGYNEVVNGVMDAGNNYAVCAVLAAGNANDHSRNMQTAPLADLIIKTKPKKIDLLKVTVKKTDGSRASRYAHSYIGLGLTPVVAAELNKHTLNALREAFLVVKSFYKYRPFKIEHAGRVIKLDSLLFANINQMAKILTLAPKNRPDDGLFEIVTFPAGRKWKLLKKLAKAAVSNLDEPMRKNKYKFKVIKKMPMQLDGEVMPLEAGSQVRVECAAKALKTLV